MENFIFSIKSFFLIKYATFSETVFIFIEIIPWVVVKQDCKLNVNLKLIIYHTLYGTLSC